MKPEKQLYQWGVNQYLTGINPAAQFVDYPIGDEVIRIKSDGTRCRIPDEVLQTYGWKTCYERYPDGTYRAYSFTVLYAPKPPDYIYTPEERTTFEALTARVDAAIDEIKRRADSGEFTPKKGVDYFTDTEKNEMMENVSSGAVGEFRNVVDTATTEYNDNAAEKLTTYDTNAEQHTTDYNRNAAEKLYAYNSNHTEKVAEYNQNAETKTAEFDANADALQTEVDRLRGECDKLSAENRKQENRIDALIKLNKGQTYDIIPEEGETVSRTAPSGAKYVGIDKVGGKSVVWNQLWNYGKTVKEDGITLTYDNHFYDVVKNTTVNNGIYVLYNVKSNNKYYVSFEASSNDNIKLSLSLGVTLTAELTESNKRYRTIITTDAIIPVQRVAIYLYSPSGVNCSYRVGNIKVIDLSAMFGAGNEPSTVEEFEAMFPKDYYEYCEPIIISSHTDRVDVASADGTTQQITTGFPVLNSARSAYDYIDLNEGKLHQRVGVVDLGSLSWIYENSSFRTFSLCGLVKNYESTQTPNILTTKYTPVPYTSEWGHGIISFTYGAYRRQLVIYDSSYTDTTSFKSAMNGVMLYYELAEEVITDIDIPTEFTEWLQVEPGGTVTFRNADDSKQLAVPNAVSWVRKLNEVE